MRNLRVQVNVLTSTFAEIFIHIVYKSYKNFEGIIVVIIHLR